MPTPNEYLTPKERAKKFSTGNWKASETGARGEAARHLQNQTKMNGGDVAKYAEDYISGKKKLPG